MAKDVTSGMYDHREATAVKSKKPPKVLDEIRMKEAENGGHIVSHHFTSYEHPAEEHVFGKDEGAKLLAHVSKTMKIKNPAEATKEELGDVDDH